MYDQYNSIQNVPVCFFLLYRFIILECASFISSKGIYSFPLLLNSSKLSSSIASLNTLNTKCYIFPSYRRYPAPHFLFH